MNRFYVITNVEKDKNLETTRQICKPEAVNVRSGNFRKKKKPEKMEIIATQTPP